MSWACCMGSNFVAFWWFSLIQNSDFHIQYKVGEDHFKRPSTISCSPPYIIKSQICRALLSENAVSRSQCRPLRFKGDLKCFQISQFLTCSVAIGSGDSPLFPGLPEQKLNIQHGLCVYVLWKKVIELKPAVLFDENVLFAEWRSGFQVTFIDGNLDKF
jgi:hypothetical protein